MNNLKIDLKVNSYKIVSEIVESGILEGWNKANRVSDNPSDQTYKEHILSAVMIKLEEYIEFK